MANKPLNTVADVLARLKSNGTVLNLGGEKIGDAGARLVAAALPQCKGLAYLGLYSNSIGADGARALAAVLPQCTALQTLYLSSNSIGADGACALAAVLPQCTALQNLNIWSNSIGDDGARAVAAALPKCTALQKLYLDNSNISDDGARALLAALPQCPSLQELSRSGNKITDTLNKQIDAELAKNKQPERIQQAAAKHAQAQADRAAKKAAEDRAAQQATETARRAAGAKAAAERAAQQEAERIRAQQAATETARRAAEAKAAAERAAQQEQAAEEARRRAQPKPPGPVTPPPPPASQQWVAQVDPATSQTFYYNASTGESSWTPPSPLTPGLPPPPPAPKPPAVPSTTNAMLAVTQQLHQFAITSPEAGATSPPSPQLQAMEQELQTLRAQTVATQAALAKATADAQSLSAAQAAKLLEQAAANAAAMQRESNAQMASMEKRLVSQLNGLASEQEKVKVVLLYVEAKLASYLPMLDEAVAKRELDKVRSALNAKIRASPKHDAYHRAFLEVLNATFQAAMVIKTDFVALQSQTGATKAAGVVNKIGAAVGAALSFTPASPIAGMAVGAATSLVSYFLGRLGEREQRDQLGRLTDAFPSPAVWFDLAERVAAAATEAKWEAIAKLEEGGASANKFLQFFKDAADYLKTHSTPPIWQRTAAMDALAGLDAIMQGGLKAPVDVDNAVKVLVAAAMKDAPASKPTPPPVDNSGISKAEVARARERAADLQRAAEETERIKAQWKHKLASANDTGPSSPVDRIVTVRTWSKRKMDGGKKVTVTADLAALKADAGKALGITVAALRDCTDGSEVEQLSHVRDKDILIATTAEEESLHY